MRLPGLSSNNSYILSSLVQSILQFFAVQTVQNYIAYTSELKKEYQFLNYTSNIGQV